MLKNLNELIKGEGLAQILVNYIKDVVCRDKAQAVKDEVMMYYTAVVVKGCYNSNLIPTEAGVASLICDQAVEELAILSQYLVYIVKLSGGEPLQRVPLIHLGVKVKVEELEVGSERRQDAVKAQNECLKVVAELSYIKHVVHVCLGYSVDIKDVGGCS